MVSNKKEEELVSVKEAAKIEGCSIVAVQKRLVRNKKKYYPNARKVKKPKKKVIFTEKAEWEIPLSDIENIKRMK